MRSGSRSSSISLPAPVGGWNARDAIGDMDPADAVYLTNYVPTPSDVELRKGYSQFVTGISGQVESLMVYNSPTTSKMFGAAGSSFYNVSTQGAVGAAVQTGLSNARWQSINISTSGGSFMLNVNGSDKLRGYDGTNWWTDGDGTHDITGVDTSTCIQINLFKNRVWLVQKNTLKVWYLGTNSIAGAANALDFQSIARKGGYLVAMGTWTIDAGVGVDDHAVFVTSQGEVIVYAGTDPSSSTTWALVGVWEIGAPIGRRCFLKFSGDLLLITQDGLVPLSGALQSSRVNPRVALTDKIQSAMSNAATSYGSNFGWQIVYYAKANLLFLNVPVSEGSSQEQYVMNTINKSWCNFQGWNANCWTIFNDEPYFGANGFVGKAWDTYADNSTNINGLGKQAFNYFRSPGQLKRWTMMRPIIGSNGTPSILANINVDFDDSGATSALTFSQSTSYTWDGVTSLWDTATWGTDIVILKNWQGVNGVGYCCAPRLQTASMGITVKWISTDLVFERGGIL